MSSFTFIRRRLSQRRNPLRPLFPPPFPGLLHLMEKKKPLKKSPSKKSSLKKISSKTSPVTYFSPGKMSPPPDGGVLGSVPSLSEDPSILARIDHAPSKESDMKFHLKVDMTAAARPVTSDLICDYVKIVNSTVPEIVSPIVELVPASAAHVS